MFCVLLIVLCLKCSSSHGTGPWEGAFNQQGNKLTIDGDSNTSSLLKFQSYLHTLSLGHRATWSCDYDSHKYYKLLQL